MRGTVRWRRAVAALLALCVVGIGAIGVHPVRAATFAVSVLDNSYSPEPMTIAPGTTVVWTNRGRIPHTVTSDGGSSEVFDSNTLAPGRSFTHTFSHPGVFTYHCSFHDNMLGTVVVEQPGGAGPAGTPLPSPAPAIPHWGHTVVTISALDGSYRFTPGTLKVKAGTTVTWQNVTDVTHTVSSETRGRPFTKRLGPGGTITVKLSRPGTYRYHCTIHPGMAGKIVVHR